MKSKIVQRIFCAALFAAAYSAAPLRLHGQTNPQLQFPANSGVLNVRDFGAKGDGKTDDTEAIQKALAASGQSTGYAWFQDKIVYLPNGIYRISAPLLKRYQNGNFASGMLLLGQSREKTILKLADHAAGYGDPKQPRAMILTTSQLLDRAGPYGGDKDYPRLGEGNDAYEVFVENMTVDVGKGNRGAIAIDFLASNLGALRNLRIVAGKDSGLTGVAMVRKWIGPAIVEHVSVTGFDVGVDVSNSTYCATLHDVHLSGQRKAGLRNHLNSLAIEALTVDANGVPAIVNDAAGGLIVLVGGSFRGKSSGPSLVENRGSIVLHGTRIQGFQPTPGAASGNALEGVLNEAGQWKAADGAWKLPVLAAPEVADEPLKHWVSVTQFGAMEGDDHDATAAFQRAFSSGASTVYIPHGNYTIQQPIDVPATLHHIVGMNSSVRTGGQWVQTQDEGMFRISAASTAPLLVERLAMRQGRGAFAFEDNVPRTLVLRDIPTMGRNLLLRGKDGGNVFLDDTCCGGMRIAGPSPVVARQFDTEGDGTRIQNNGAPLWILGIKTERPNLVAETLAHGRTEILGGLIYMVLPNPKPAAPAFHLNDASMTASFTDEAYGPGRSFEIYLQNDEAGKTGIVDRSGFAPRSAHGDGRVVPLLQGGH